MEMWWIGFHIEPFRLIALILLSLPLYVGISSMIGFREEKHLWDNIIDVLVAYALAFCASALVLLAFRVITSETAPDEVFSMILLQAVPGSLGALLARSQLSTGQKDQDSQEEKYTGELIILITGALFLAFNVAPTEEMVLISYLMTPWHSIALVIFTVLVMHMFTVGSESLAKSGSGAWSAHRRLFIRFTAIGYVLAFAVSVFMLWVFGRSENDSLQHFISTAVVLSFPAGVGAAASRLII
ncbi:TIGR02587 family membrane protein [Allohahella marinimesophila]|uniref:TIGR02587 family membrane protein n=2 Tax=Allohahella marinimesophila TaxID=1054972 RepID=A0ABP7P1I8_9GAMM